MQAFCPGKLFPIGLSGWINMYIFGQILYYINEMATYFQDCGVIVGLVSYPFHVDGKKLYEEVFKE